MPDVNSDEEDGQDETWILYDRMLIDDELFQLFSQFAPGVRIFLLSDSCHSGTVARYVMQTAMVEKFRELSTMLAAPVAGGAVPRGVLPYGTGVGAAAMDRASSRDVDGIARSGSASAQIRFRGIPTAMSQALYQQRKREYDTLQYLAGATKDAGFGPSLILISGCQDNQLSQDGDTNGLFTENLLNAWNSGGFNGDYRELWNRISLNMPPDQTPNFYTLGDVSAFSIERPFTIKTQTYNPTMAPRMWVEGASSRSRSDGAPNFRVDTQAAPFYVVEFATSLQLFDAAGHGADRRPDNFWASWTDSPVMPSQYGFYPMPNTAWNALKHASQIYYRVGTTTAEQGYPDYRVSTDDVAMDGPYVTIL
jgi:metacaspase-1